MATKSSVAFVAPGAQLTEEEKQTALSHCPVVRMQRRAGELTYFGQAEVDDSEAAAAVTVATTYVITPEKCIGCGICVRKVGGGKLQMLDW